MSFLNYLDEPKMFMPRLFARVQAKASPSFDRLVAVTVTKQQLTPVYDYWQSFVDNGPLQTKAFQTPPVRSVVVQEHQNPVAHNSIQTFPFE
ncbi:hypothetical protein OAM67_01740 [bacterium]|nr:hypothetical protein [bacterium]